jgi:hypothetical protein
MKANDDAQREDPPPAGERRKQDRLPPRPGDWESLALSRVAGRVEALSALPGQAAAGPETAGFGWEQRVLANLRRHLKAPGDG